MPVGYGHSLIENGGWAVGFMPQGEAGAGTPPLLHLSQLTRTRQWYAPGILCPPVPTFLQRISATRPSGSENSIGSPNAYAKTFGPAASPIGSACVYRPHPPRYQR